MAEKMMTVNQVSRLCGISVRTLHYYDELGLLSPSSVTGAGYRMYGKDALSRLQQILFFRELDFSLKEIRQILDNPSFDPGEALSSQREILTLKRDRLNGLISLVDSILKGEKAMSFAEFDQSEIEAAQEKYAAEARERWGGTEAYRESQKKTSGYSKEDWNAVTAEQEEIFRRFAAVMDQPP